MIKRYSQYRWAPIIVVGLTLMVAPLSAQSISTRVTAWNAWSGCWEPVSNRSRGAIASNDRSTRADATLVCIVPEPGTYTAELLTINAGEIVSRSRVDASGERHERSVEGCTGWERTTLSGDRKRFYSESEFTCPGDIQRRSTSVHAITPGVEWLDVSGVTIADQTATQVRRYRVVDPSAELVESLPAEIRAALRAGHTLSTGTARSAAAVRLDIDAVIDASDRLDTPVTAAWLVEQAQSFNVDAKDLRRLASARVPDHLIDLLVALSYPTVFAINRNEGNTATTAPPTNRNPQSAATSATRNAWDPLGYYGMGFYAPEYYSYGYNVGNSYYTFGPHDTFYRGYRGGRYPIYAPIIILTRDEDGLEERTRGRVTRGKGYSRGKSPISSPPPSPRRSRENKSPSAGASSSSSPGQTGSVSGGGGSGSSSGRKAKPRGRD